MCNCLPTATRCPGTCPGVGQFPRIGLKEIVQRSRVHRERRSIVKSQTTSSVFKNDEYWSSAIADQHEQGWTGTFRHALPNRPFGGNPGNVEIVDTCPADMGQIVRLQCDVVGLVELLVNIR